MIYIFLFLASISCIFGFYYFHAKKTGDKRFLSFLESVFTEEDKLAAAVERIELLELWLGELQAEIKELKRSNENRDFSSFLNEGLKEENMQAKVLRLRKEGLKMKEICLKTGLPLREVSSIIRKTASENSLN